MPYVCACELISVLVRALLWIMKKYIPWYFLKQTRDATRRFLDSIQWRKGSSDELLRPSAAIAGRLSEELRHEVITTARGTRTANIRGMDKLLYWMRSRQAMAHYLSYTGSNTM